MTYGGLSDNGVVPQKYIRQDFEWIKFFSAEFILFTLPQWPTYTARLFLKIVRAMCQEMYKKKYNDHVKTKYMQKYNYLITHFHANRRLVLIALIAAITDTGSKR